MSISPRFLDELRNRLSLSEVIGRKIKVTRAGREYKACCPFHHEKTPSFTINDDKQFYHCFGCGAHGDVIKFTMEHDNLGFMDAIEVLAAQAGMAVPQPSPQEAKKAKEEKSLHDVMEAATQFFQSQLALPTNEDALKYLTDRGLAMDTIAEFRLGFAPADGQALYKYLKAQDFADKDMLALGLIKKSTKGGEPYAFFRDRVMFPVPDRRGRIVAFGGRVLPEHLRPPQRSDFTPPKYINSSETPLFHKGKVLYGEPIARRAAAEGQPIVLVEGYLDVIACAQAGVRGALAPMGTAVTEDQIIAMWQMIPDFSKVPILCFDGDNAGRKAAQRVSDRVLPILEPGKSVNFAFMPDGEDPDSLIQSTGVEGFRKSLDGSMPLFNFIWMTFTQGKDFRTPEMRAGVTKQLENEVARISDADVQRHYKEQLREKISQTFFNRQNRQGAFKTQYAANRFQNKGYSGRGAVVPPRPVRPQKHRSGLFPRVLLAALINHPHIYDGIEETLCGVSFKDPRLEKIRQILIGFLSEHLDADRDMVIEHLRDIGFLQEIGDICKESVYVHASFCSTSAKGEDVQSKWLEYWSDGNEAGLEEEIQSGWKRAFMDSSEEEEEKLRNILSSRKRNEDV